MTAVRTRELFDVTAATYDEARARLIPGYNEFYATALALLPDSARTVLDLGAGTGLFSAMLRARLPEAHLVLIDNSEAMLVQAKERFADDANVSFQLADYTLAPWDGPFDVIASALSIHHLEHPAKRELYRRGCRALKAGGVFVNAEQIAAPTPELELEAKAEWLAGVRALRATEEQIKASLLRQTADRCATVEEQLAWMREAGFRNVAAPFQQGRFAVLYGIRR